MYIEFHLYTSVLNIFGLKQKPYFFQSWILKRKTVFSKTCINAKTRYLNFFEAYCVWIESNTHVIDISLF